MCVVRASTTAVVFSVQCTQWAETKHKNLWLHYIIKWCAALCIFFLCFGSCPFISIRLGSVPLRECSGHGGAGDEHCDDDDEPSPSSFIISFLVALTLVACCCHAFAFCLFEANRGRVVPLRCLSYKRTRSNHEPRCNRT